MKNKKLNLSQIAQKSTSLSAKEQKAVKGGYKFFGRDHDLVQTRIIIVDIRIASNPSDTTRVGSGHGNDFFNKISAK